MNLQFKNDEQVYIAVFDIPLASNILGFQTQTLALVYELNTHIYHGNGRVILGLGKNPDVMKAMQLLLISSYQVLKAMKIADSTEFYNSDKVRVYLKTRKGIYFKEIAGNCKEDAFLLGLMNYVLGEIGKQQKR